MSTRMMRYVVPAGDNELIVPLREPNYHHITEYERNVIIYVEENEDAEPELAILRFFETGEAVEGEYMGTLTDGKAARHLYWVNAYELRQAKSDESSGYVRVPDEVPEMQDSWGSEFGEDAPGQG